MIFYEAFIITGTFFLLGGLMLWHAKLIHQGETSIGNVQFNLLHKSFAFNLSLQKLTSTKAKPRDWQN